MDKLSLAKQTRKAMEMFMQNTEVTDAQAVEFKGMYPKWEDIIGQTVKKDFKFLYGDTIYKTIQEKTTIQAQYIPGQGTSAIYTQINESAAGTKDNPIPVPEDVTTNAFTYVTGKYYIEDGVIYKCYRQGESDGTEHSFVYKPSQLLNQYFVLAE